MANCTISTKAVNDCHLQFFDSLGNLIYEFDLEGTIALNNGNGILIKDDLTTLTIDKNVVVDNLGTTVDALITYIQEQRVLCTCECGTTPTADVTSATWGYDTIGTLFYVKQMSDGSVQYESPIGTAAAPSGAVTQYNPTFTSTTLNVLETNAAGLIPTCLAWTLVNTGGASFILNGAIVASSLYPIYHEGKTINGAYYYAPSFTYDATGSQITITYQYL